MILPTKGITPDRALISLGAEILRLLDEPKTISRVWEDLRRAGTTDRDLAFDWYVLALDLLFALGTISIDKGRVQRQLVSSSGSEGEA